MLRIAVFSFVFFLTFSFLQTSVFAQSSSGVGLTPIRIDANADPGEILEQEVTISNLSDTEQTYYLHVEDISGVQGAGAPIFADPGAEKTGYELSEWVATDINEMTLAPGDEQAVVVTISVPDNATPGSHFGGIFVSVEPPRLREVGASVGYQVVNIVSIKISGDVLELAQIRTFSTDRLIYGETDVEFTARVENKGNTLIRPIGPLEVFNMFGERVALVDFNESQGGVFPKAIRDFTINWEDDGIGFGRYEALVSLVYGEKGVGQQTISSGVSFWILPMKIIKPALITLGILLLVAYITIRLYVRRTLQRAQTGRSRQITRRRTPQGPSVLLLVSVVMLVVTALFLLVLLALFA